MTYAQAQQKMPKFAKGLLKYAHTKQAIQNAVMEELEMYRDGTNPLTEDQVKSLQNYLKLFA